MNANTTAQPISIALQYALQHIGEHDSNGHAFAATYNVVMLNAIDDSGARCEAFIGGDRGEYENGFATSDVTHARAFDYFDAVRRVDHWRGYFRGFHGGVQIEMRPA